MKGIFILSFLQVVVNNEIISFKMLFYCVYVYYIKLQKLNAKLLLMAQSELNPEIRQSLIRVKKLSKMVKCK